jgi:hypothetical protein
MHWTIHPEPSIVHSMNIKTRNLTAAAMLFATAYAGVALAADTIELARNGNEHWVGTWSTALHEPDLGVPGLSNPGFNNETLRQIVHLSIGGRQVRIRLSAYGAKGLVVGAAHVAIRSTGAVIDAGTDRTLTFGGNPRHSGWRQRVERCSGSPHTGAERLSRKHLYAGKYRTRNVAF